jgi:hypothetical protein
LQRPCPINKQYYKSIKYYIIKHLSLIALSGIM